MTMLATLAILRLWLTSRSPLPAPRVSISMRCCEASGCRVHSIRVFTFTINFRITSETRLWTNLRGCLRRGLTEDGRAILNVGKSTLWAGVLSPWKQHGGVLLSPATNLSKMSCESHRNSSFHCKFFRQVFIEMIKVTYTSVLAAEIPDGQGKPLIFKAGSSPGG